MKPVAAAAPLLCLLAPVVLAPAPARSQEWMTPCRVALIEGSETEGLPSEFRVEVTEGRVSRLFTRGGGYDTIAPMEPVPHTTSSSYGFSMESPAGSREATDWQFRLVTVEEPGIFLVERWSGRVWTERRQNWAVRLRCVPGVP
ncbi:hypothetical protein [Roseomonas sp. BN140053]|uniref:hypothetical protein n=1 Tax=Roseomonas sp. BN140053 TaxID=3391898 RepID=UPI0039EC6499